MTIRLRILALLSLLSLASIGTYFFFARAQRSEEADNRAQHTLELATRLQRLVSVTGRPAYRYLRNYAGRAGMTEFLTSRDPAWAGKYIRDRLDTYRLDSVWVLQTDGTVLYGWNRLTDTPLVEPPLPPHQSAELFQRNGHFSFHVFLGDTLYQVQGMPIVAPAEADRKAPARGWLLTGQRWGQLVLEDLADAGQGRVTLTGVTHRSDVRSAAELEAWVPLLDHVGLPLAGLDYHVLDPEGGESWPEKVELGLFIFSSVVMVLLVAVLLHYWILRPFSFVRASLVARDPAPLAPLLAQRNEFGQMARVVQSSMHDRERLEQSLAERVRLGRELHDGAIQGVYGAGMALSRVQSLMERDLPAARRLLTETRAELNRIIHELRGHIETADPRPESLTFGEAVGRLIQQMQGAEPLAPELRIDESLVADHVPLYRSEVLQFLREAISNAIRHGRPAHLNVSWQRAAEGSILEVGDDGVGFDQETVGTTGRGLGNLRERALSLGGRLSIDSHPNRGTRIILTLPAAKGSP